MSPTAPDPYRVEANRSTTRRPGVQRLGKPSAIRRHQDIQREVDQALDHKTVAGGQTEPNGRHFGLLGSREDLDEAVWVDGKDNPTGSFAEQGAVVGHPSNVKADA